MNNNPVTDLVLGEDKALNVQFRLSNEGVEPAIGTNLEFSLPIDLDLMDSEESHCNKQHIEEGSGGEVI